MVMVCNMTGDWKERHGATVFVDLTPESTRVCMYVT